MGMVNQFLLLTHFLHITVKSNDVMESQIISHLIVCSIPIFNQQPRKHQRPSLSGIHQWIPSQRASYVKSVSMSWHHHSNIAFIFSRHHCGWAAMTTLKYKCDSIDLTLTDVFTKAEMFQIHILIQVTENKLQNIFGFFCNFGEQNSGSYIWLLFKTTTTKVFGHDLSRRNIFPSRF